MLTARRSVSIPYGTLVTSTATVLGPVSRTAPSGGGGLVEEDEVAVASHLPVEVTWKTIRSTVPGGDAGDADGQLR